MYGTNMRVNTVKITMKGLIFTLTGHFTCSIMTRKRRHVDGMSGKTAGWGGGGGGGVRTIPSPKRGHNVHNENSDNKVMHAWSPINPLFLLSGGSRNLARAPLRLPLQYKLCCNLILYLNLRQQVQYRID